MEAENTFVIVLGAGASKEVELPIGTELTDMIAYELSYMANDAIWAGGNNLIRNSFRFFPNNNPVYIDESQYLATGLQIKMSMPLAPSIDNYIDNHRDNPLIARVAKLAISYCILKAEKESLLNYDPQSDMCAPDFSKTKKTWYNELFMLLAQFCSLEELEKRLSKITIISFNYDRCFLYHLIHAIKIYFNLPSYRAFQIASKIKILYPYGNVGSLIDNPYIKADHFGFGLAPSSEQLFESAKNIRTFTESNDDNTVSEIRHAINGAQNLVFLGFSFIPSNMKLLFGSETKETNSEKCKIFGTTLNISDSNNQLIQQDLVQLSGVHTQNISLHQELNAYALISNYSRYFSKVLHT